MNLTTSTPNTAKPVNLRKAGLQMFVAMMPVLAAFSGWMLLEVVGQPREAVLFGTAAGVLMVAGAAVAAMIEG